MTQTFTAPLVLITVGGDHHPFDRLMRWVDNLIIDEGDRIRCVVQHGPASPPLGAECFDYLDHRDLLDLMNTARVVVSSGGPSTLLEARGLGHRPIVVPRQCALGEHVDDHQRAFAARLHDAGVVRRADTEAEFRAALRAGIDAPRVMAVAGAGTVPPPAVARVGGLIDITAQSTARRHHRMSRS
jgi:UDP-N-acetylglucosamine transferase subunit ALG13